MLTILVFEINKGKKRTKSIKKITIIYHYLLEEDSNGQVCGGVLPQKARKCHFLHSEHPNLL